MNRTIAGVWDPGRRAPAERSTGRVRSALAHAGRPEVAQDGPLTLGWTAHAEDVPPAAAGVPALVLDGLLYADASGRAATEASVAALLAERGESLLGALRGDFALVWWDARRQRLVLARDHIGGRSLVWTRSGGCILFASEAVQLLAMLDRRPAPDDGALAHWLAMRGLPRKRTLYAGVAPVEPGHVLALEGERCDGRAYWVPRYQEPPRIDRAEAAARIRAALTRATARRTRDGAGVLLSGGLDSSSVAAAGAERLAGAWSAVFPRHPTADEAALIQRLTAQLGLRASTLSVEGGSVLAGAMRYLRRWALPPVSPNLFFWVPLLEGAAADGVPALLDGEGGDELFGAPAMLVADRLRRGRPDDALRLLRLVPGGGGNPPARVIARFGTEYGLKGAVPLRAHRALRRLRGPAAYAPRWMKAATTRALFDCDDEGGWKALDGPRWWSQLLDDAVRGANIRLTCDHVRRRSALAGVDARQPLLDVDLVELVLRTPPGLSFDPRHTRPLLREAMAGLLPDEIRLRSAKSNFDAPFHEALTGPDLPALRGLFERPEVAAWVDAGAIRGELLARPPAAPGERRLWAQYLWRLATAECWLRVQSDSSALDDLEAGLAPARLELARPVAR